MNRINTVKLHRLIKSLKKEEKRYFKIFTKKQNQKEDVFYLKIFDYLDKLEAVDRDKFKQKFKKIKGLSGVQKYLYKLILKSLRNQPTYNDTDVILREGLGDLEILYKKKLFAETEEKFQELLHIAKLHDRIFFIPTLYEWWFRLENSHFQYRDVELVVLEQNIEEYAAAIENLKHYHLYRVELGRSLFLIKDKNAKQTLEDTKELAGALPPYDPNYQGGSLSVRIQELQLRRFWATRVVDTKASYYYSKELSSLLRAQPKEVFEVYEAFYYRAMISQIGYAPKLDIIKPILEELENAMVEKKKYFNDNVQANLLSDKISYFLLRNEFKNIEHFLEENQKKISFLMSSVTQYFRSYWYYKLMLYNYAIENYTKALAIFDQFLVSKDVSIMVKGPSLFLKMVIYYEEQEYILLASFLTNLSRYLRKKNALLDPEKQLITLMNKLVKLPQSEHKAVFIEVRKNMISYLKTADEFKKEFFIYFNYIGWMDSQISGAPFKQFFFRHTGMINFE